MKPLVFEVPMKAPSTMNLREHHMARNRRTDAQTAAVYRKVPVLELPPAYEVRLTRIGVRKLDGDNLQGAFKAVRDAVAKRLGVDDGSSLIRWTYAQETDAKGKERVRIEVEAMGGGLPTPTMAPEETAAWVAKLREEMVVLRASVTAGNRAADALRALAKPNTRGVKP